jgi:hypothetical protein
VQALRKILRSLVVFALPLTALAAAPITGTVTNRTTGKPAAGDTVVLIRLTGGMQESTHTTTDARGHFSLDVPDAGLHLVRVTHDKTTYFQPAQPGTTSVDVDVYSAAPKVKGVTTEAIVMRIQTDASGNNLNVVENFFIKNDSTPPTTQFSNEPFDFYLPEGAIIEGSAALAPGGMPLKNAPVPLSGNKYTFLFPLRPGETRFQVTYHIPYAGKLDFPVKIDGPTGTVALMLPKAMKVQPAANSPLGAVNDEVDAQTFVAQNATPTQPLSVSLSGSGQLPRDSQNPSSGATGGAGQGPAQSSDGTVAATDNTAPGKGLDNPLDPNGNREPLSKYKWWILAGLALLLAIAAGILLRKPSAAALAATNPLPPPGTPGTGTGTGPGQATGPGTSPGTGPGAPHLASEMWATANPHQQLLAALKEELFAVETDHLQNRIDEPTYLELKSALELILRRALSRTTL